MKKNASQLQQPVAKPHTQLSQFVKRYHLYHPSRCAKDFLLSHQSWWPRFKRRCTQTWQSFSRTTKKSIGGGQPKKVR